MEGKELIIRENRELIYIVNQVFLVGDETVSVTKT